MPTDGALDFKARIRPMARATFLLSAALILAALLIGYISYNYSFHMMEKSYQSFYLNKAEMIVKAADIHPGISDKEYLKALEEYWQSAGSKPADEYICVVDQKGDLLLHTANPETVGNYAGDNPILNGGSDRQRRLCDLVVAQTNYTGQYISSSGKDQIAAFVAIPERKWMLGVHRSRSALYAEIEDGFRPLQVGFLSVCGILMPIFLFLLYKTYSGTQRRQLAYEQALRDSEKRYHSLVDTMPQCLCRTDREGRLTFANQSWLQEMGRDLGECLGKAAPDLYPESLARQYVADEIEVISTGRTLDVVHSYQDGTDDTPRFVEMVHHPVRDAEGVIVGVQSIFWDVTDKKLSQEKLKHTKAQLETVLQSVPSGILAVDSEGRITIVNQKAEQLLGFSQEEMLGKPADQCVPGSGLMRVLQSGKMELGKPFVYNQRTFMVSRSPIMEHCKVIGAVSVLQDESELESVQKQLDKVKRLNDELSSLIENSHDGVLITDSHQVITANPSFGRITGLAPSSLVGREIGSLDSERHVCLAVVQAVFRHVKSHRGSITMRRKLKSGHEIFVTGNPVLDKFGQVVRVVMNVRDVTELHSLEERIKRLSLTCLESKQTPTSLEASFGIVAESPASKNLVDLAVRVAQVDSTVLLCGESGVGKDVLAKLIHNLSKRHDKPFVSVNCGAIPEHLLESELFGYEKGAFSGADRAGKPGLFEEAAGGTLFLDEVGELPLKLQVKLLKVLQEQRCRRLGSVKTVDLDIRILAATNRDLKQMVSEGRFREDLFYRLYVVPIEIPPLRERREDILPLALRFLKTYNKKYEVSRTLGHELLRELETADWPGNVRELQNVIERLVVTADTEVLEPRHLPRSMHGRRQDSSVPPAVWVAEGMKLREARDEVERQLIKKALAQAGNTREAAKLLGVTHSTVVRKAQKFGLRVGGDTTLH